MSGIIVTLLLALLALAPQIELQRWDAREQLCTIEGSNVECNSHSSPAFNLSEQLAPLCPDQSRSCHFGNLFLYESAAHSFSSAHFGALSFDSVHIYSAAELESFVKSDNSQDTARPLNKQVFVSNPSRLNTDAVNELILHFPHLVQVEVALTKGIEHRIAAPTEYNLRSTELKYLIYSPDEYQIGIIEDHAFDWLTNVEVVKLANIPINHLSPNALSFRSEEARNVVLNLDNCWLTDSTVKTIAIDINANSSALLILDNNYLSHVPQTLQPFLNSPSNLLSLYGNLLDCTQIKLHLWLLREKSKYRDRIWGAKCATGENLFDLNLYEAKCSYEANGNTLECVDIATDDLDLRQEVVYLQQVMDIQLESLQSLIVANCNVAQLPANALGSVRVLQVQLENMSTLMQLDANAFSSSSSYMEALTITGMNQLTISSALALVNSLVNLHRVLLSLANGNHVLPQRAFASLSHMQWIEFSANNYRILSIGTNAIGRMSSLSYFGLGGISIGEVASDAFAFADASTETLHLNLSGCALDETKLRNRPFDRTNRPLSLDLSRNSIRLFEQNAFEFLLLNPSHQVNLAENQLTCQIENSTQLEEHPYFWVHQNFDRLTSQVLNAKCSNSVDLFEFVQKQFETSSSSTIVTNTVSVLLSMLCFSALLSQ